MIPIESNPTIPSLIIGHNVAFDRTYIKEQYQLEVNERFIIEMKQNLILFRVLRCDF
jgi:hypothetical protein